MAAITRRTGSVLARAARSFGVRAVVTRASVPRATAARWMSAGPGASPAASAGGGASSPYVVDVTSATFEEEVVRSKVPVILDCWAPWCGPCRQLTPMLETLVGNAKGALKLAKLNVDEVKDVAGALKVSSIPAVFGVANGRVVDSFVGVVDQARMQQFVEALVKAAEAPGAGPPPSQAAALGQMLEVTMRAVTGRGPKEGWPNTAWAAGLEASPAEEELKGAGAEGMPQGAPANAGQALALLGEVKRVAEAMVGQAEAVAASPTEELSKAMAVDAAGAALTLVRVAIATEGGAAASEVLSSHARLLEIAETHDPAVSDEHERVRDAVTTAGKAEDAASGVAGRRAAVEADPTDVPAAAALADALVAADEPEEATAVLLSLVRATRKAGDDEAATAAREALFAAFDRIGAEHPAVTAARRELARLVL